MLISLIINLINKKFFLLKLVSLIIGLEYISMKKLNIISTVINIFNKNNTNELKMERNGIILLFLHYFNKDTWVDDIIRCPHVELIKNNDAK